MTSSTFLARCAAVVVAVVLSVGGASAAAPAVQVSGGSAAQRTLARQILERMGPTHIGTVRIGPVPKPFWGEQPRTFSYLTLTTRDGAKRRGEWESLLFAGAFADLSRERQLPAVFGLRSPDSARRLDLTPSLPLPPLATRAGATALAAQVKRAVSATAGASGVRIVSLKILRPDGLAFALVIQASDPAAYMKHQLRILVTRSVADPSAPRTALVLEGRYFALQDAAGSVVWQWHTSTRLDSGGTSTRHDLSGCNPFQPDGAPGYSPPACPAA